MFSYFGAPMPEIRSNLLVRRHNPILTIRLTHFVPCHAKQLIYILSRRQAMQKYKEVPWWWYTILLALSFIAGQYYCSLDGSRF
jgi:hypothetical protein